MQEKMIKVLYVIGGIMKYGGIEAYIMNYYRHLNKEKIQIDFVVHGEGVGAFDDEIISNGGKIYHVPVKSKNFIGNIVELKKIMNNSNYDIVHVHMDGMNAIPLKIAKDAGIKVRISHSHNTGCVTENKIKVFLNEKAKTKIAKYATHLWGCSKEACEWLYGNSEKYEIIPNAIDVKEFAYDEEERNILRKEFGFENSYVIGHVGRIEYQKNHELLLEMMADLVNKKENVVLVCVGIGSLEEQIKTKIRELNIEQNVKLLGERKDVAKLMNMFDLFLFPSRFEGLGIVAIEAQANGLKCILSENVPSIVNISGNCMFLPIDNALRWSESVGEYKNKAEKRGGIDKKVISRAGYDIITAAKNLQEIYINQVSNK